MNNPFAFVGNSSLKDNFIGRKKEVDLLTERVLKGGEMTCVVGLPRMGKTSLMWHVFFEKEKTDWWLSNRIVPIYSDVSKQPHAKNLWGAIATNLSFSLKKMESEMGKEDFALSDIYDDLRWISRTEDAADRHNYLETCLKKISESLNIRFLFVFDELDYLWKYNYTQDQFCQLRSMSVFGHIVTCSRRKPNHIEKMACKSNYFDNKTCPYIWISPFTSKEVEEYWLHFKSFFGVLDDNEFCEYRKLVERYTGNHPHMMNIMNSEAFESGSLMDWHKTIDCKGKFETERRFRFSLEKAFKKQLDYIKEQELDEAAINLVLGGSESPKSEQIEDLQAYGFVRQVPNEIKWEIFGYDMGPMSNGGKDRFICMSGFFSHLMKEEFEPQIKGLQLLKVTEKKMQMFVKELLKRKFGQDCLESDEDESSRDYKEKWELHFEPKEDEWNEEGMSPEDLMKHKEEIKKWKKMRDSRFKRVINGCKPPSERPPIDTLSSFDIGSFMYIFFDKKKPWSADATNYAKKWNKKGDFQKWVLWRNAEQHFYVEEKTDEFIKKAEESCRRICKDIDDWMALY